MTTALNTAWGSYRDQMYPDGITPLQNKECHQAFMAGSAIMLELVSKISSQMPEDVAMLALDKLQAELTAYANTMSQQSGS